MFEMKLTAPPDHWDEHGRPRYLIEQRKGLYDQQDNHLFEEAKADGYVTSVGNTLKRWIRDEVAVASAGRKLDMLEIGGGRGTLYDWLKESARTYVNVDPGSIVPREGDLERWQDPKYARIGCSGEAIPLEDESVDVVISNASFDHLPDYRKGLAEIARLLKKNGSFILTLNNRRSWWKALLSGTGYLRRREAEIAREHYFQWSFAECAAHLSEYLSVERMSTVTFLPFVPTVWRPLLPLSDRIGRFVAPKYGSNIVAVCRKRG